MTKLGQDFPSYLGPKREIKLTGAAAFSAFTGIVALMIGVGLLRAFVLTKMWGWFILPTFVTAPDLSIPVAWGIAMMIGFITNEHPAHSDGFSLWGTVLAMPFVVLLFGWILSSYV